MLTRVFDALDHVILAVRDLAEATRRYATLFARRPSWRGEHPGQGTANTLFKLHNTYLELIAVQGRDRPRASCHRGSTRTAKGWSASRSRRATRTPRTPRSRRAGSSRRRLRRVSAATPTPD